MNIKNSQLLKIKHTHTHAKIKGSKATPIKYCEWCGSLMFNPHHSRRFCCDECFKLHRKDYKAEWKRNNEERLNKECLGGSMIGAKANADKEKEARIVRKELNRLGLHKRRTNFR